MSDPAAVVAGLRKTYKWIYELGYIEHSANVRVAIAHIESAARESGRLSNRGFFTDAEWATIDAQRALTNQPAAEPLTVAEKLDLHREDLPAAEQAPQPTRSTGEMFIGTREQDRPLPKPLNIKVPAEQAVAEPDDAGRPRLKPAVAAAIQASHDRRAAAQPPADEPARQGEDREIEDCIAQLSSSIPFHYGAGADLTDIRQARFEQGLRALVAHLRPPRTEPDDYIANAIQAGNLYERIEQLQAEVERKTEEAETLRQEMQADRWVSCAERLPVPDAFYLVWNHTTGYPALEIGYRNPRLNGWFRSNGSLLNGVTHWMPLPEPPQSEGGGVEP